MTYAEYLWDCRTKGIKASYAAFKLEEAKAIIESAK